MERADRLPGAAKSRLHGSGGEAPARLRLYVAQSTPNSVRAASNLKAALSALNTDLNRHELEIIDVFADPKRAITAGIIVTPTLIGLNAGKRVVLIGDLGNQAQLTAALTDLLM